MGIESLAPTADDLKAMETLAPVTPPAPETPPAPVAEVPPSTPPVIPPPQKDTPEQQIEKLNNALREARNEIKNVKERAGKIDEIKDAIASWQRQQEEAKKPQIPDFNSDPIGHQQAVLKQIQEQQEALAQETQNLGQQTQLQQFITSVQSYEQAFRQTKPDYDAAQAYLTNMRKQELAYFGITDEAQINQDLAQNAYSISVSAIQNGKNPAEVVYNLATARGYKGPAPVVPPTPSPEVQKQAQALETIQKGQAASQTLTGKGETEANPSLQALLDAPVGSQEFEKQWNEYFGIKK